MLLFVSKGQIQGRMRLPVLLFLCFGIVISLTVFKPARGQDEGPPRVFTAPRPSVTAAGQGYAYTWCEYNPVLTCYDTTVSTTQRQTDGPTRLAVPVPEDINYFPLVTVILFTIVSGIANSLHEQALASSSSGVSGPTIVTTPPPG